MQISNKNGKVISNLSTWKDAFIEVDNARHWKEGKSAHSLALHFTRPSINDSKGLNILSKYLGYLGYNEVLYDYAEIEHESSFDAFRGNGRIQDLMIWARNRNQLIAICIEAKVDESFDMNVPDAYEARKNNLIKKPNSKALERLENICRHYYKDTPISKLNNIRYQLLYYLAGSINEAKKINGIVFMPVFVYLTNSYNKTDGDKNKNDYKSFMESLDFELKEFNDNTIFIYQNNLDGVDVFSAYIEIEL